LSPLRRRRPPSQKQRGARHRTFRCTNGVAIALHAAANYEFELRPAADLFRGDTICVNLESFECEVVYEGLRYGHGVAFDWMLTTASARVGLATLVPPLSLCSLGHRPTSLRDARGFPSAAASMSRFVNPASTQEDRESEEAFRFRIRRGKALRKRLGITDRSPTISRSVRNGPEHMDK
jgi:hypothetical protein